MVNRAMNEVLMINIYPGNKQTAYFGGKNADFSCIRVYLGGRVWKVGKSMRLRPYFISSILQGRFFSYLQSLLIDICRQHLSAMYF